MRMMLSTTLEQISPPPRQFAYIPRGRPFSRPRAYSCGEGKARRQEREERRGVTWREEKRKGGEGGRRGEAGSGREVDLEFVGGSFKSNFAPTFSITNFSAL